VWALEWWSIGSEPEREGTRGGLGTGEGQVKGLYGGGGLICANQILIPFQFSLDIKGKFSS
jgi:hypothetical protein